MTVSTSTAKCLTTDHCWTTEAGEKNPHKISKLKSLDRSERFITRVHACSYVPHESEGERLLSKNRTKGKGERSLVEGEDVSIYTCWQVWLLRRTWDCACWLLRSLWQKRERLFPLFQVQITFTFIVSKTYSAFLFLYFYLIIMCNDRSTIDITNRQPNFSSLLLRASGTRPSYEISRSFLQK